MMFISFKNKIATSLCAIILAPFSTSSMDDVMVSACGECTDDNYIANLDTLLSGDSLPWLFSNNSASEVSTKEISATEISEVPTQTLIPAPVATENLFLAQAIDDSELDTFRGASGNVGISQLDAFASNNKTVNSVTGKNAISDNALSGANGVTSLIQNSGNNVIIQNSTIVNLTLEN